MIAVRYFDARAQYAVNDFVTQAGGLYRAIVTVAPGAFNAANWEAYAVQSAIDGAVAAGDAAVTAAFEAADAALQADIDGKLPLTGGTLSGALFLPAATPTSNTQAAHKKYVDDAVTAVVIGAINASDVVTTPTGAVSATNVQAAIAELDAEKAALFSPAFSGNPTAPTPPANDNDLSIATTAFIANQAGNSSPAMDGAVAPGTSLKYAREDHVHPVDTSRAPLDSPQFVGVPVAPTAPVNTNTNQIATTAFVIAQPVFQIADGIVTYAKMAASAITTANQFLSNTAQKILTTDRVWAAAAPVTLTDAIGTPGVTPDFNAGIDFIWTLTGAGVRQLNNPTNPKPGQKGIIYVVQDGVGDRKITTWGAAYKFSGGNKPTLSFAANAVDVLSYAVKSTSEIECFFAGGMA